MMDAEFAFIDWRRPEAITRDADGNRDELRSTEAEVRIRVAPGHAVA